jgi:polyisoprenoid-binding protein YceI
MNGAFTKFGGHIVLDLEDVTRSQVSLSLDLRSAQLSPDQILQAVFLQTAVAHLRPPETSFVSKLIERKKEKTYLVHGAYQWQGKTRNTTVPVQIIQVTPSRAEVRVLMNGAAKPGESPDELRALGDISLVGTKGWAKGTFVFARKG